MPATPPHRFQVDVVDLIPALRRFARQLTRNATDADDLVQETLVKALANVDKFEHGTRLKSWLFTIMRNTFCTNVGRSRREVIGAETTSANHPVVPPRQEWAVVGTELQEAMRQLPVHYRIAIDLVLIEGESYQDAAEKCDCKIGTIKSRVNRGRLQLAERLGYVVRGNGLPARANELP